MIRKLPVRIAAATAGLILAGGVAVAAAGSPPDADADDVSTVADDATVAHEADETEEAHELEADDEATEDDADEQKVTEELGGGPVDNHGAEVSAVAHTTFETGREHGAAVSEVARGDNGPEATDADETDDEAEEHRKP